MRAILRSLILVTGFMFATQKVLGEEGIVIVDLALVDQGRSNEVQTGVARGLAEANLLGRFTGQEYRLRKVGLDQLAASSDDSPAAILAALPAADLERLSTEIKDVPIFNITADDNRLRTLCRPNLFHIIASQRMIRDAAAQWRSQHPDSKAKAVTWHHEFVKYAARDLNKRYQKAHSIPMNDQNWAAWAAVKLFADAVTRTGSTEPKPLLAFLKNDLEFDGNKGVQLNFRPTGQLRQPLLIIEDNAIIGEAPVRGVADIEDLDSLGINACSAN